MDRFARPVAYFDNLSLYLEDGIDQVDGWLNRMSAIVIAHLSASQVRSQLRGDVCEIGVHHGKLFLVLANTTADDEVAHAVDVFGDQHKNLDHSGLGDRGVFEQNVKKYAPYANVNIIQESSLDLDGTGFMDRRFRMVSIDGGHTAQITLNDLQVIERCLIPGGIVIIDDVLNPHWLGVVTGVSDYFRLGGKLVPFAGSSNKIYLTTDSASADAYRENLAKAFPLANERKSGIEFFTGSIDYYGSAECYEQTRLRRSERELGQVRLELEEVRRELAASNKEKQAHQESLIDIRRNFEIKQSESENLRTALKISEDQRAAILSSTSWRVTGLLRWVKTLFL